MSDQQGGGQDWLTRSMMFREAEAGNPMPQHLQGMDPGASIEQMQAFLSHPEVQKQLQGVGIPSFDPQQIRTSPFFSPGFMQGHPQLGGRLTNALANVAQTPPADLVSGAGSGMQRFAQGMAGGPEMLRQYGVRQLMAPFAMAGATLPLLTEERRVKLLQGILEHGQEGQRIQQEMADIKRQHGTEMQDIQQQLADTKRLQAEKSFAQDPMGYAKQFIPKGTPPEREQEEIFKVLQQLHGVLGKGPQPQVPTHLMPIEYRTQYQDATNTAERQLMEVTKSTEAARKAYDPQRDKDGAQRERIDMDEWAKKREIQMAKHKSHSQIHGQMQWPAPDKNAYELPFPSGVMPPSGATHWKIGVGWVDANEQPVQRGQRQGSMQGAPGSSPMFSPQQ